jgi:transcriptional regulator with XRE-family HTH domain
MASKGYGYNHIKRWLDPKLDKMGISIENFANLCGISKASIYFYRQDVTRPDEQSMARICQVLGVPLEEGLAQYTPRPNGRPRKHHATSRRSRRIS